MITSKKIIGKDSLSPLLGTDRWIIFDIETTGLSHKHSKVILIGYAYPSVNGIEGSQTMITDFEEEALLLLDLLNHFEEKDYFITFNGDSFDIPFVNARLRANGLNLTLGKSSSYDVYRRAKKLKLLQGESSTLKSIEKHFGIEREDTISGKESVALYKEYQKSGSEKLKDLILLHNHDDIVNLYRLTEALTSAYPLEKRLFSRVLTLYGERYAIDDIKPSKGNLRVYLAPLLLGMSKEIRLKWSQDRVYFDLPVFTIDGHTFLDTNELFDTDFDTLSDIEKKETVLSSQVGIEYLNIKMVIERIRKE